MWSGEVQESRFFYSTPTRFFPSTERSIYNGSGWVCWVHWVYWVYSSPQKNKKTKQTNKKKTQKMICGHILKHEAKSTDALYTYLYRRVTNGRQTLNKWVKKHNECRCFQTGVLQDAIKQLTSYHALQPLIKLSERTGRLPNTFLKHFVVFFL